MKRNPAECVQAEEVDQLPRRVLPGKLGTMPLWQQVVALSVWPLAEQVMNLLVGTVDLALAGHLEPERTAVAATDALGVTGFIGWLMGIILGSLGVGAGALVSRAVGGNKRALANAGVANALMLALVGGGALGLFLILSARVLGQITGLQGESLGYCALYLRIVMLAAPAASLLFVGNACLRAAGDTRTPFTVMIIVNLVNLTTSVALVYAPAPIGGHGVAGIAAGTFIAWWVGCGIILLALLRGRAGVRLLRRRLKPHWHTMRRIVRVGAPNLAETLGGTWLATFLVLMMVGRLGGEGMLGAHMIAVRVESFSFQPGFALSIAAATLVGQYLGLGDPQRARQATGLCWLLATISMGLMGTAFIFAPRTLLSLMTDAPLLLDNATRPLQICGFVQAPFAAYIVLSGALRGAGDTRTTMKLTYLSVFTIRVPWSYLLGHHFGFGLPGIWVALCVDLTSRGTLFAARFLHGGWMKVKV